MPLPERPYRCPVCGALIDRDDNAALHLKKEGLRMLTKSPGTGRLMAGGNRPNGALVDIP